MTKNRAKVPQRPQPGSFNTSMVILSLVPLCAAIVAAGMMAARHIWSIGLPGCGAGGGCDWAIKSQWSTLLGMPVAFLGLGFFVATLLYWIITARRGIWGPMLLVVRIGAIASVGYLILIASLGHFCVWCVTTHLSNLIWWSILEFGFRSSRKQTTAPVKDAALAVVLFLAIVVSLKLTALSQESVAETVSKRAAEESIAKIGTELPLAGDQPLADDQPVAGDDSVTTASMNDSITPVQTSKGRRPFGGRYWTGARDAAVRIVVFHDYRCQLCKEVEDQIEGLLATRNDVAVSVKQWPFDKDCNPQILGENVHPGSCLAARYAEAAGLAGGDRAFWQIHRAIMKSNGEMTVDQLALQAKQLGLDWIRMQQLAQSETVDSILAADIQDGLTFGIKFTPMVFVNGYELQGWQSAGAIPAAVDRAALFARQNPKKLDQPDAAAEREFMQWLNTPMTRMQIRKDDHILGQLSAPAAIIMYGDLSEPYMAAAYDLLRPLITDTAKVCFIFRSFPLQAECNDMVKRKINDRACEAARMLEASGVAGGNAAYWKTFRWFMGRRGDLPRDLSAAVSKDASLDSQKLTLAMNDVSIDSHIAASIESAKQLKVNSSPTIYINGRTVTNWRTPGLMKKIIDHLTETRPIK